MLTIEDALKKQPKLITGKFRNKRGEVCAIGAMAMHANIPIPDPDETISHSNMREFATALCHAYDVSLYTLELIEAANDTSGGNVDYILQCATS